MKKFLILSGILILGISLWLILPSAKTQALPEYAAQTSEPCLSCHISPSGGGARGPRGQAWVASDKPAAVPDLVQSLELLGVKLSVDPDDFIAADTEIQEAEPLGISPVESQNLYRWLSQHDGN
jgi:hypothetical protein